MSSIVDKAASNLRAAISMRCETKLPQSGPWWAGIAQRIFDNSGQLMTPEDAIAFAEYLDVFEWRPQKLNWLRCLRRELRLGVQYPQFAQHLSSFSESQLASKETVTSRGGRHMSTTMWDLVRFHFFARDKTPFADTVCEIGGGYGAPARICMLSPLRRPRRYIVVDLAESIFLAEIYLRAQFPESMIAHMAENPSTPTTPQILLCPVEYLHRLDGSTIGTVINTWSMQEMSEEWVDFYMNWLEGTGARFFYSYNAIGLPLNRKAKWSGNSYSPRPSPNWSARFIGKPNQVFQRDILFDRTGYTENDRIEIEREFDALCEHDPSVSEWPKMMDCLRRLRDPHRAAHFVSLLSRDPEPPKELPYFTELASSTRPN
jgi:putative sugar O-methyltransferase